MGPRTDKNTTKGERKMGKNYGEMIDNAKSVGELKRITALVESDQHLDDAAKSGYVTQACERRMYDFGDLMGC